MRAEADAAQGAGVISEPPGTWRLKALPGHGHQGEQGVLAGGEGVEVEHAAVGLGAGQGQLGRGELVVGHRGGGGVAAGGAGPAAGGAAGAQRGEHRHVVGGDQAGALVGGQVAADQADDPAAVGDQDDDQRDEHARHDQVPGDQARRAVQGQAVPGAVQRSSPRAGRARPPTSRRCLRLAA